MRGVAGAPVSFGIFEMTSDRPVPDPDEILSHLHEAGYDGVDLGPVGWMGGADEIGPRLAERLLDRGARSLAARVAHGGRPLSSSELKRQYAWRTADCQT
jgi:sugar phosphate isomerase/epimerase